MKGAEKIKDRAYMVLLDLAFCFDINEYNKIIKIYNLKNIKQVTLLLVRNDGSFLLRNSNMSEANKYKGLDIAERNKEELMEGLRQWESILKED